DGRHGQHPSLARCPTATAPQRTDATAPHRTDAIATAAHLCSRCLPCTAISGMLSYSLMKIWVTQTSSSHTIHLTSGSKPSYIPSYRVPHSCRVLLDEAVQ
ncbi:hypothetical protein O3P69_016252, partial [Scylla paramamosain]